MSDYLPNKRTCGYCPQLQEPDGTHGADAGKCLVDGKFHDIMETACGSFPEDPNG